MSEPTKEPTEPDKAEQRAIGAQCEPQLAERFHNACKRRRTTGAATLRALVALYVEAAAQVDDDPPQPSPPHLRTLPDYFWMLLRSSVTIETSSTVLSEGDRRVLSQRDSPDVGLIWDEEIKRIVVGNLQTADVYEPNPGETTGETTRETGGK